jgi:hypothetical protein
MGKFSDVRLEDRLIILLTAGIFCLAAVTAFILVRQANVMEGQLEEMKAAGGQTERLVILNVGQMANATKTVVATQLQAQAAQDSVRAIRRQTQQDQRPYIWIIKEEIPHVKLGEKVAWNFHYTNFGKSPAVGVVVRCQVRLAAHRTPELKDMFAPIHKHGFEYEGLVIPLNDTTNWSTCFSEETVTEDDLKMLNTYDAGAKLMLYFEYYDTSWNAYTSQVCKITRRPGQGSPIAVCPAENKIK